MENRFRIQAFFRPALTALAMFIAAPGNAPAAIKSERLAYKQDTAALEGLLVYESSLPKAPGIVMVPDWMGMTDRARQYAEKVASLGYIVLVADIYGKGKSPKDMQEAGALAGFYKSDRPLMRARAGAALNTLRKSARVDTSRIAAMGYCFGGGVALELARSGAGLDGVVSFHGNLDTPNPAPAKAIQAKVLVLHGADDPFVPQDQVKAFQDEMRGAKVDWQLIQYGNAVHSFTNPDAGADNSKGAAYNPLADRRSFQAMRDFFGEVFAGK